MKQQLLLTPPVVDGYAPFPQKPTPSFMPTPTGNTETRGLTVVEQSATIAPTLPQKSALCRCRRLPTTIQSCFYG